MAHEKNSSFEIDGKHYVIPTAQYDVDKMTPKELVKASIAVFNTGKEADDWARKRSDNYKKPMKKKRDYKDEYNKFQKDKSGYRAKLNKFNRKKGTYGNGDGLDASHKGGKIKGFESQSKNRGRREKSRKKGFLQQQGIY